MIVYGQPKVKTCFTRFIRADAVYGRHRVDLASFNAYLSTWFGTWRDRLVVGKKNRVGERRKRADMGARETRSGASQDRHRIEAIEPLESL